MTDQEAARMVMEIHVAIAAVCPVESVALSPGDVAPALVQYDRSATAPQLAAAAVVLAGWDYTPRVPKTQAAMVADIAALTGPQQTTIFQNVAAAFLLANPTLASSLGVSPDA